jgi:trans-aconitate methyltransferase
MKKFSTAVARIIPFRDWATEEDENQAINIFAKLKPVLGERILIIGCADGGMGRMIKNRGCSVVGIDNNVAMIEMARKQGIDARLMNGENLIFKGEFDGVISYSALHWMRRPDKVVAGVWNALKPNGRYVGAFGAYNNISQVIDAFLAALQARGIDGFYLIPWYFPSVNDYNRRLENAGFYVDNIEEVVLDQELDVPLSEWIRGRVGESFASVIKENEREKFFDEVEDILNRKLRDYGNGKVIEYRVICFNAIKTEEG